MAILVSAKGIGKTFGVRPLFEGVTFVLDTGERAGLIGPNGAGKSTLLKILAGRETVDSGEVSFQRGLKVGFLEQVPTLDLSQTVEASVMEGLHGVPSDEAVLTAGEVLSKLELTELSDRKVQTLSGGWRKRVALARELVKEPELLLLDEPTNHLDIESILWLEGFLQKSKIGAVIVTHDRVFLQKVTTQILELDRRNPQGLLNVRGDYSLYLQRKSELLDSQQKQESVLRNTLRRETEWLRRGPKARTTKQQARINAAGDLQKKVDDLEVRNQHRTARLDFQSSEKKPKRLIEAVQISKKYGNKTLFHDLDVFLGPSDRIGLLGVNGAGKSTLVRVLLGLEPVDSGKIIRSEHVQVAYFEQNRESLDPKISLKRTVCPHGDHVNYRGNMVHVHGYLDRFLFKKEQVEMPIGRLSGGEQSRVLLALLMLKEANVLVLDEPTNDLDVETLDVLQDCLTDFDGAVLLVTHDRYFLDQVATEILAFPPPEIPGVGVVQFADRHQWENWRKELGKRPASPSPSPPSPSVAEPAKKKKLGFNETRELAGMEASIHKAEAHLEKLQAETEAPENQANAKRLSELFQELTKAQEAVEKLYNRWAELERMGG